MTNPTSNYNFQMPTATDLVTDLPADFEVFGQAVDTRLKALQPGTTLGDLAYSSATANTSTRLGIGTAGQVLAVSGGGVPAWTTTADVTPLTTKGDLFTFTTVDARIGVGANNTVLTADSAEATGLKWATPTPTALTLITTTSFTAVATQSFNNVFSATYDSYMIMFKFFSSSNNPTFMRMRTGGADATGGNYNGAVRSLSSSATLATEWAGSGSTSFTIGNLPTTASTTPTFISMTMHNPYSTTNRKAQTHNFVDGDGSKGGYGWGQFTVNGTAYDGFSIFNSTGGATTLTGTVSIYGMAK